LCAAFAACAAPAVAQNDHGNPNMAPVNDLPNPYSGRQVMPLPNGRTWGSTAGVDAAKGRDDIWAIDRCGSNTCVGSHSDPILHYDASGKLIGQIGAGLFAFPHGIHVDDDGNVWQMPERLPRITSHAAPDEEPDATGDAELQARYMAQMEQIEVMVDAASTLEDCEACRSLMGSGTRNTRLRWSFRADRNAGKLGPADEREFTKAWQRMNRKLDKKEADLDPGSAAEIIDRVTGEVIR
jgi:hypothetical protein